MNILLFIKYVLLGIIQGITEPLPISSSGHLIIFQEIFNLTLNDLNYEVILNFGSLFAIIIFYRKDIKKYITNFFLYVKSKDEKYHKDFLYCIYIVFATIPAGIIGFFFMEQIETIFKSLLTVGLSLIITGILLTSVNNLSVNNEKESIHFLDAITMGLFQVIALIPGISRSGSTIVGGLSRKIKLEETLKFSFLMYIPISAASGLYSIYDITTNGSLNSSYILTYICGFIVSLVATLFAIGLFIKLVKKGNLKYFAYYCYIVGISLIIYILLT